MNQSTSFAQVATNLLNVLQGYTKGIRFVAVLTMLLTVGIGQAWGADTWTLVKDVNELAVGDEVVIAASGSNYALGTTQNSNNRAAVSITKSGDNITWTGTSVQVLTLKEGTVSGTFAFYTGSGYLYAASSSKNYLRTQTTNDANGSWKITITSTGVASITAQGTNTSNQLKKNSSSALFSCYSSRQNTVAIYKKQATVTKTLSSITLSGQTTTYNVGDNFSFDGTCTANYSDGSTKAVTPTSVSSPDMNNAGTPTITVSYTEGGVTVKATYTITVNAPAGGGGGDGEYTWELVDNVSTLKAGDRIVIAAKDYNYAISTDQKDNNRGQAAITKSTSNDKSIISVPNDDVQILTLENGTTSGTFAFYTGTGYLYAASSGSNYLRTQSKNDANGSWEITISDNTASIIAQGTNTRNTMQYNSSSSIFACYSSASQKALAIYKEVCTGGTTETSYSVTSTLSRVTAAGGNPTTITSEDKDLTLFYSPVNGWNLPATISVTMGGTPLSSEIDYMWDQESGELLIGIEDDFAFTGDIVVTINGWQQLAPPSGLNVSNITSSSATLSWGAVANASSYTVELLGENKDPIKTFSNLNATTIAISDLDPITNYILGVVAVGDGSTYLDSEQTLSDVFTTSSATCTVTYDANGGEGTITDATKYTNGATVTVLGNFGKFTKEGHAFTGWNTKADGSGDRYNHNDQFDITTNTTLYAQWCKAYWKLVTDESELENDTRIVIAAKDYNFALSTTQNTNNRGQAEIIKKYNTITFGADVQTLSLVGLQDNKFALYTGSGYLYAASSSNNYLKTKATHDNNCYWSIGISETVASIYVQGGNSHNQIKYNHQQNGQLFSCYERSNTSMSAVVIYKEVCVQDQYNVASTLTNATAVNTNPTTVAADATSLTLNYSADAGYLLPENITVKMGGAVLASGTDYNWNKETGALTITVTGFYGDIDVKIDTETDPCYGFAMSEVTATSTTNSITLSWTAVEGATGYNLTLNPGEFSVSTGNTTHTFDGLSPKTEYTWEVQAVKDGANFHCEASKTGSTTTQKETFTVSWSVNGNVTSTESVVDGEKIKNYPSAPSGCSTKVFVGWTNQPIPTETNETPTLYTGLKDIPAIIANTPLYAVWADKNEVPGEKEPAVETIISKRLGYDSGDAVESVTSGVVNIAFNKGNNSNVPKYYSTGEAIRTYGGNYFTITSDNTITSVKLTFASGEDANAITTDVETYSDGTWTGSANSVKFTVSGSSGHRRISQFAVTYLVDGEKVITYSAYTTLCDECTPSTLTLEADNTTADLDINSKATITFSTTGGNGGEIVYAANPKAGVTWDNGTATFAKAGEYSITASQGKNGEYCPTTSNSVNVTITAIPHLYFVTEPANPIVFDPVECGGNTRGEDKKSVSVQAYNLAAAVTAQVTGPYKIARTSGATLNEYSTTLTLDKNKTDGNINGDYDIVYILSFPPAGSSEPTEGTLTFTTTNGNTLTVNLSTPTITCTPRTLTFNDRGIKTTQEYYAGTEVPEPATPTGVCGEYEFDGWALAKVESGSTTYAKVEFPYIMPANNQTVLHAVYRYTEVGIPEDKFMSVDANIGELESGKDYVLTGYYDSKENNGDDEEYAVSITAYENGKYRTKVVDVNVSSTLYEEGIPYYELNTTDNEIIWTITGDDTNGYIFQNKSNSKYLNVSNDVLGLSDTPSAFTIVHETGVEDGVDVYYMSLLIQPKGSSNYLSSYNKEDVGVLFNIFKSNTLSLFLYKRATTPLYTTTPDCHPSVTLISDGEVYVTATNGRGIMAATPLTLTTTDLAPNTEIAISSNSSDIYFSTERNTNFAMAQASQPKTSLTLTTNEGGELEKQLYIHYKPSADGDGTPAEVVVTADVSTHNPPFTAQKTIHVRNLPAKFVIATKAGATWYALPANMNGATNPSAVVIEVDETTMTATAPNTTPYTLWPVATINGGTDRYQKYGERLRFAAVNNGNKGLWANNADKGTTINNNGAIVARGDNPGAAYEWKVTTAVVNGQWQYTLQTDQANNQKNICYRMNQENPAWGTYASNEAQYQLYFLPIKAETTPFDYQVVEWYPNKVLIHTTTAFSSLIAKIAGEQVANVQYTAKDANQYEVTGLPLMENPAKALTLEFVVADATHTGIYTIPVMLSGGNQSISSLSTIGKGVYNYTDLVVRDGATLTIDGDTKADNTFYDVTIYPTAKISVPEGKQLSVHRMTFIGGITEVYDGSNYTLNKYAVPELSLKGNLGKTVTTMDYVMRVNLDQMYSLALPYDVALDDITYGDGSAIELGSQLYVSAYDGAARAKNLGANNNWVYEIDFATKFGSATLKAGVGYTISAQPQTSGDNYAILRLPMKSNIASGNTEAAKSVAVTAHGAGAAIADNHKGWNLVANPYMASISGDSDEYSELMLRYMEILPGGTWQWTGEEQRYVTIPYNDGSGYYQLKFSEAVLQPFKNFFVQVGTTGNLDFVLAHRQNAPARYMQTNTEREVEFEIILGNSLHQDNAGMLISDKYTPAYEINADLEKMTGSMSLYTIYNGYKLAYNATSLNEAEEWIPVGYIVPKVGEYTFKLDERAAVEDIIHIYLMDNETGVITDLIDNTYTFETSVKKNENRFAIRVVLSQEESGTTTGVDDLLQQDKQAQKFIYNDQLFILRDGVVYDAMGQRITTINK